MPRSSGCGTHPLQETLVESRLARDLGVEGRREEVLRLDGDDSPVGKRRERRRAWADLAHEGRADEGRVDGRAAPSVDGEVGLERIDLAAEGVARDDDVESSEGLLPVDRA